jgi:hypothetical protein
VLSSGLMDCLDAEIDPASAASGFTLLLGAIVVMRGQKVRI